MKYIKNILFYSLLAFFLFLPIWFNVKWLNYVFMALLSIPSLIYIIGNFKKIHFDLVDILFIVFAIASFLPVILHKNVSSLSSNLYSYGYNAILLLSVIALRRIMDKEKINDFLIVLSVSGFIYFIVSMLFVLFRKKLMLIGIFTYFGDQYVNSIDRFYGTMDYCNISALYFAVTSFISLFKIREDKENKLIFSLFFFIELIGLVITYSKMVSIIYILMLIILIIYLFIRKKRALLHTLTTYFISSILPVMFSLYIIRSYYINHNLLMFLLFLSLDFLFFYFIIMLLYKGKNKFKYINYVYLSIISLTTIYFTLNPVATPVFINSALEDNEYYLIDFVLADDQEYNLEFNVTGSNDNLTYAIYKLYIVNLIPQEEKVVDVTNKDGDIYSASFTTNSTDDNEYYMLKVEGINKDTSIALSSLKINDTDYYVNTLFVPYTIYHQISLIKYDEESATSRLTYYRDALKILKNNGYIIGHGIYSFGYYVSEDTERGYLETDPHSFLLDTWLNVGILGLLFILGFIIIGIIGVFINRQKDKYIIWFVIYGLMICMIPFDLVYDSMVLRLLLYMSLAMTTGLNFKITNINKSK